MGNVKNKPEAEILKRVKFQIICILKSVNTIQVIYVFFFFFTNNRIKLFLSLNLHSTPQYILKRDAISHNVRKYKNILA